MGYLSQKKKQTNIKEILNISFGLLSVCSLLVLFGRDMSLTKEISHWLFQIYTFALLASVYALLNKCFWQMSGLFLNAFILFLNIGMGGNLFFNVQTSGLQSLNIFYGANIENVKETVENLRNEQTDIAAVFQPAAGKFKAVSLKEPERIKKSDKSVIAGKYKFFRSGVVLLSPHHRVGFADMSVNFSRMVFIFTDFAPNYKDEQKTALSNLAEFINMQDIPVIVIGNFHQEAWSADFLNFLDKTRLEVKNRILLGNETQRFNPIGIPSFNILAYKDFGIRDISYKPSKDGRHFSVQIKLNY